VLYALKDSMLASQFKILGGIFWQTTVHTTYNALLMDLPVFSFVFYSDLLAAKSVDLVGIM